MPPPDASGRHRVYARLFLCFALSYLILGCVTPARAVDRMWVDAKIDGKPARLAFDTGSSHTVLFRKAAQRLGLKINPAPAKAHPVIGGITDPVELQFGRITARATIQIVDSPPGVNVDVDGLLGWLPIRDNVIVLDGTNKAGTVGAELPPDIDTWQKLTIRPASGLYLEVPLPAGGTGVIFVDSGTFCGFQLPSDRFKEWVAAHPDRPATLVALVGLSTGVVVSPEFWADELSIGSLVLHDIPLSQANETDAKINDFAGTMGIYGLRRLRLVLDNTNRVAYVKLSDAPPSPYEHNRLGAVFCPKNLQSDPLLAHVAKGSPADLAGIRDGDILTKIDDLNVTKWRTDPNVMPMSRFFDRPAGTKIELTIDRNGQPRTIAVVLKDILVPAPTTMPKEPASQATQK